MRPGDRRAAVERIAAASDALARKRSLLVAISGIDGAGKGHVARVLADDLAARGLRTVTINVDGWLNLPARRFSDVDPGPHFYRCGIRFDEMFSRLVLPLRDNRSVRLEAGYADETAGAFRSHLYDYRDVDVILLEGVFLLKRSLRSHYDLALWIDCTFRTALERAISRAQEGLSPDETVAAYRRIYFPAQTLHFDRDRPRDAASLTIVNDPWLPAAPPPRPAGVARTRASNGSARIGILAHAGAARQN